MGLQGFYNKYYYYLILFINHLCTETLIIKRSLQSAAVAMVTPAKFAHWKFGTIWCFVRRYREC